MRRARRAVFEKFLQQKTSQSSCPEERKSAFNYCDMPSHIRSKKAQIIPIIWVKINVCAYTL